METCLRGFSFMPENRVDVMELQYIEGSELERTWKSSRRQRLKDQESRIWEEFVKEKDIVSSVCQDDPYQFLDDLPETCLKELLDDELKKLKEIGEEEKAPAEETPALEAADAALEESYNVTFATTERDPDMFQIFDDDVSGPEDEALNDSPGSPCTVREREKEEENELSSASVPDLDKQSNKSENMTDMIENSIYCAKVRDLRRKINDELLATITCLENKLFLNIDPEDLAKMKKRSSEFCARFNRIHLYQIQRQVHDIDRNNSQTLPFAKHTHFQSQMVRIASLHQSILHAVQVFHKALEQGPCAGDGAAALRVLSAQIRASGQACARVTCPGDLVAARDLYRDNMEGITERLDFVLGDYTVKVNEVFSIHPVSPSRSTNLSNRVKPKKKIGVSPKTRYKSDAEGRLSMYSLDIHRKQSKSSGSNLYSSCGDGSTKKYGINVPKDKPDKNKDATKNKSPRYRRPLMRDPHEGLPRRQVHRDTEVETMVEAVDTCASSRISRDPSPYCVIEETHKKPQTLRSYNVTPRKEPTPCCRNKNLTPRQKPSTEPPKPNKPQKQSKIRSLKTAQTSTLSDSQMTAVISKDHMTKMKEPNVESETKDELDVQGRSGQVDSTQKVGETKYDRKAVNQETGGVVDVSNLLKRLCGGDGSGSRDRATGARNAQLLCVSSTSTRQPSTPELLKILEETIQKKTPRTLCEREKNERLRMTLSVPERVSEKMFQYRTRFVQHMLASPMYANSVVGKPWEVIGKVSEQIIEDLITLTAKDMELNHILQHLYLSEMN